MAVRHRWLALVPETWHTLLVVVDDATEQVLYAQLGDRSGNGSKRYRLAQDGGPLRKTRHRGVRRVGWLFTLGAALYNLVRIRNLIEAEATP